MEARELLGENARENMDGTILDDDMNELLQRKYAPMLEGITDSWNRRCMAQLYENQVDHLNKARRKAITESTGSGNVPDLVKFVFPVVKKVWPNLVSNGLFSVQPTSGPIGGIFYWDLKYGTTKGNITAGDKMVDNFDRWYSSEFVENETVGAGPATNFTGTMSWKPVKPYGMGQVGIEYTGVSVADGSTKVIKDVSGTGSLTGDVGAASTLNYTSGVYNITFSTSVTSVKANYFYDMESVSDNVPQVNVNIQLDPIKVKSRKLKFLWSSEVSDDMRTVLNMDVEPELTSGVASEIQLGIDRELIMAAYGSGTTNQEVFDAAVLPGRNQVDHYRNLTTVLEKVSGTINTRTKRGPGNFIVMGPSVQPIFGALATHGDLRQVYDNQLQIPAGKGVTGRPAFPIPTAPSGYGVYSMGWLQNKWLVIVDPYFPVGKIMVGLKGPMFADSGLVYAPYIPMEMTSAFLDPSNWTLRKGVRTRYAKKLVNNNFFGIITVTNLP